MNTMLPFIYKGCKGFVEIEYEKSNDPERIGYDLLPNKDYLMKHGFGYPYILAAIKEYTGFGIRTFLAWIQIIDAIVTNKENKNSTYTSINTVSYLEEIGFPFYSFGNSPQFFDAPCCNLGDNMILDWNAYTFLVNMPIRRNKEKIEMICGFKWGYVERMNDTEKDRKKLIILDEIDWKNRISYLNQEYPEWNFY